MRPGTSISRWLSLVTIVLFGVFLRAHDTREQVLAGDEYHALRVAADRSGFADAFTYYGGAENSIPLTLYARALMDTVGVTELGFRIPAIVSGLLILLFPLMFRRLLGWSGTLIAIALIACCPVAVYYSFVARPYGPAALLLLIALLGWWSWIGRPSPGHLVLFVVPAALAVFFHLLCLFPVGWLVVVSWVAVRRGMAEARRTGVMTLALLLLGLALLGPGLPGLLEYRLLDSQRPGVGDAALAWNALLRISGENRTNWVVLLILMLAGSMRVIRREPLFGLAVAGLAPALVVGMWITQPFPTLAAWTRYSSLTWPFFLMLAAVGAAWALDGLGRVMRGRPLLAVALLAIAVLPFVGGLGEAGTRGWVFYRMPWIASAILGTGAIAELLSLASGGRSPIAREALVEYPARAAVLAPLLAAGFFAWTPVSLFRMQPDSLRTSLRSIRHEFELERRAWEQEVPAFFHDLARAPDGGDTLIAWPYAVPTPMWGPLIAHQRVHGRRVVLLREPSWNPTTNPGIYFENVTDVKHLGDFREEGARYVVMCLEMVRPENSSEEPSERKRNKYVFDGTPPKTPAQRDNLRTKLKRLFGEPIVRDEEIEVYDMWSSR